MKKRSKTATISSQPESRLILVVFALLAFGLLFVADASAPQALATFGDRFYFVKQQLAWAAVGVVVMLGVQRLNYKFWEKYASLLFWANVVLLIVVLIPAIGARVYGARRWIILGPASFQPSELIKLTAALYFAKLADKRKGYLAFMVPIVLVSILVMLQPDLGTTLSFVALAVTQLFVAGVPLISLLVTSVIGGLSGFLLIIFSDYRKDRLLTFLGSISDPLGKSYHIRQILLALGSGGIFGVGLGQSRQKYLFLPESATDSIFAVIAEEIGFIGALVIILLFVYFVVKGIAIALEAPDTFSKVLAAGIVAWIGFQAFLNFGSIVALTPLTGVPLPFFSYGGSSLVTVLTGTGILLNISKHASKTIRTRKR